MQAGINKKGIHVYPNAACACRTHECALLFYVIASSTKCKSICVTLLFVFALRHGFQTKRRGFLYVEQSLLKMFQWGFINISVCSSKVSLGCLNFL